MRMVDFAVYQCMQSAAVACLREAAVRRFRPAMLTTSTAIVGAVVLMLSHRYASELREPPVIAMICRC